MPRKRSTSGRRPGYSWPPGAIELLESGYRQRKSAEAIAEELNHQLGFQVKRHSVSTMASRLGLTKQEQTLPEAAAARVTELYKAGIGVATIAGVLRDEYGISLGKNRLSKVARTLVPDAAERSNAVSLARRRRGLGIWTRHPEALEILASGQARRASRKEIAAELHDRLGVVVPPHAISKAAYRRNIRRTRVETDDKPKRRYRARASWNLAMEQALMALYGKLPSEAIADRLNQLFGAQVNAASVRNKAYQLGLRASNRPVRQRWPESALQFLRSAYAEGIPTGAIADELQTRLGFRATRSSVQSMAHALGLRHRNSRTYRQEE